MWPRFKFWRRRRRWRVWFVVGSLPGFSPGTPVFPSSRKSTLPNSYLFWNAWTLLSEFLRTSNSHRIAIALHSGRFETCIFVTGKWSVILTSHLCLLYYLKAKSFTYSNWGVGRGIKENRINKLYKYNPNSFTQKLKGITFPFQKVLVRDLFCGEISNNVVSLVRNHWRECNLNFSFSSLDDNNIVANWRSFATRIIAYRIEYFEIPNSMFIYPFFYVHLGLFSC